MRAFVVLGLVFPYQAERLAWGNVSKIIYILYRVGRKTTTKSIKPGPDLQNILRFIVRLS